VRLGWGETDRKRVAILCIKRTPYVRNIMAWSWGDLFENEFFHKQSRVEQRTGTVAGSSPAAVSTASQQSPEADQ
jgi:hypothetical protein